MKVPIPGFIGYSLTNTGEVWSDPKGTSNPNGKWLAPATDKDGYFRVSLVCPDGVRRGFRVNRLVAMTYIENPLNHPQVNHIDGDKKNNHISNLEWASLAENRQHAYDIGLQKPTQGILQKNNTSGYAGIQVTKSNKYSATISHKKNREYLGVFCTIQEAISRYNTRALELFGASAHLHELKEYS